MKKIFYISLSFTLLLCAELKAQDNETGESIRDQIKNNKVPGAKYAPATVNNTARDKGFEGSSLAKAIREGKFGGMPVSTSAPATTNNPITNPAKSGGFASEISSSEAKAAHDKAVKETQANTTPPNLTQEVKKE